MKKSLFLYVYANRDGEGEQELCLVGVVRDHEADTITQPIALLWLGQEGMEGDERKSMRSGFFGSGNLKIRSQEDFESHAFFIGGYTITDETAGQLMEGRASGTVLKALRRGHLSTLMEKFHDLSFEEEGK